VRAAGSESVELAQAWSVIGIADAHLNHAEESVDALRRAATFAPRRGRALAEFDARVDGTQPFSRSRHRNAKRTCRKSKIVCIALRLGAAYLAAGRYAESETVFRDVVAAGDPLPLGYVGLAQVLLRTGRAEDAAKELADAEKKLGT